MTHVFTRRRLLRYGALGGAALVLPLRPAQPGHAAVVTTPGLKKYVEPLPIPPVIDARSGGAFSLGAGEATTHRFHRQLGPAKTWGYGGAPYLGPTFEVRKDVPVTVSWSNNLPAGQFLPVDLTIPGATLGPSPVVMHLHGGFTLPQFDGHPQQWFTNGGATGPHYVTRSFVYGNQQRATMLWYHDHALGNTRLNVYAGLAGVYFVRDELDTGKPDNPLGLPVGTYEIPLVLQDKTFNADGTLFYANRGITTAHPVWVPEFFGDTPVVNGKAYPFVDVEPRRYRLRVVNGSQARFYDLKFVTQQGNVTVPFHVIGAEGGFLRAPVATEKFLLAPGERVDVVVDFGPLRGENVLLTSSAPAPYPSGRGGDIGALMRFDVVRALNGIDATTPPSELALPSLPSLPAPSVTRSLHLREILDAEGEPVMLEVEDLTFMDPVVTKPVLGATEDWLLINTTADTHPIHLHLVHFEVVDRRPFNAAAYLGGGGVHYTGPAVRAPAVENGLKDTVKAHPGEVTRIRAKFDLPSYGKVRLPRGLTNPQYVWHCHILEHEENDMMRPFEVVR